MKKKKKKTHVGIGLINRDEDGKDLKTKDLQ